MTSGISSGTLTSKHFPLPHQELTGIQRNRGSEERRHRHRHQQNGARRTSKKRRKDKMRPRVRGGGRFQWAEKGLGPCSKTCGGGKSLHINKVTEKHCIDVTGNSLSDKTRLQQFGDVLAQHQYICYICILKKEKLRTRYFFLTITLIHTLTYINVQINGKTF